MLGTYMVRWYRERICQERAVAQLNARFGERFQLTWFARFAPIFVWDIPIGLLRIGLLLAATSEERPTKLVKKLRSNDRPPIEISEPSS